VICIYATISQLVRAGVRKIVTRRRARAAEQPQKRGLRPRLHPTPKKPKFRAPKVARVRLTNGIEVTPTFRVVGHNLQEHRWCWIVAAGQGSAGRPLPRRPGTLDAVGVQGRMQGRSKYRRKRPKKSIDLGLGLHAT